MRTLAFAFGLSSPAAALAQASGAGADWAPSLVGYGVAAPFAGLALYIMHMFRKELIEVRAENKALVAKAVEMAPILLEATNAIKESQRTVERLRQDDVTQSLKDRLDQAVAEAMEQRRETS